MLNGFHSLVTGDPLNGVSFAPRNPDGTWGAPVADRRSGGGSTAILAGRRGHAVLRDGVLGQRSASPAGRSARRGRPGGRRGAEREYQVPRLGRDGTGRTGSRGTGAAHGLRTWCSSTRRPARWPGHRGSRPRARASATSYCASRWPAARRTAGSRTTRSNANGTDSGRILTWAAGETAATSAVSAVDPGSNLDAAYRADGRLWIAWYDRSRHRGALVPRDPRRRPRRRRRGPLARSSRPHGRELLGRRHQRRRRRGQPGHRHQLRARWRSTTVVHRRGPAGAATDGVDTSGIDNPQRDPARVRRPS